MPVFVPSAKVYIDKKLKRNATRAPDDLIGDILHQSSLSKKELYAAITELQIGGVETVSNILHYKHIHLILTEVVKIMDIALLFVWSLQQFSMKNNTNILSNKHKYIPTSLKLNTLKHIISYKFD